MALFAKLLVVVIALALVFSSPELRGLALSGGISCYARIAAAFGYADLARRPSPQAEAAIALLHLLHLPTADHSDAVPQVASFRDRTEKMSKDMAPFPHISSSCNVIRETVDGIPAAWVQCGQSARRMGDTNRAPPVERQVVLYCHGGGYVFGSVEGYLGSVANVARTWQELTEKTGLETEVRFLLFDYRLAPEVSLQDIMDDGVTVYRWLLEEQRYLPRQVVLMGDSAGGNMVHNLQHELLKASEQLPCAGVAISPWLDMTTFSDSYERNNFLDPLLSADVAYHLRDLCVPGTAEQHAWSPLSRSVEEVEYLSPTMNLIGDLDILIDENQRFKEKFSSVNNLEVIQYPGMFHCWVLAGTLFPEAAEAVEDAWKFAEKHGCHKK